jgi:hypothetical protein
MWRGFHCLTSESRRQRRPENRPADGTNNRSDTPENERRENQGQQVGLQARGSAVTDHHTTDANTDPDAEEGAHNATQTATSGNPNRLVAPACHLIFSGLGLGRGSCRSQRGDGIEVPPAVASAGGLGIDQSTLGAFEGHERLQPKHESGAAPDRQGMTVARQDVVNHTLPVYCSPSIPGSGRPPHLCPRRTHDKDDWATGSCGSMRASSTSNFTSWYASAPQQQAK